METIHQVDIIPVETENKQEFQYNCSVANGCRAWVYLDEPQASRKQLELSSAIKTLGLQTVIKTVIKQIKTDDIEVSKVKKFTKLDDVVNMDKVYDDDGQEIIQTRRV